MIDQSVTADVKGLGASGPQPHPIRVYIVEDELIYLEGLKLVLVPDHDIEVVGSHAWCDGAVDEIVNLLPNVVLIDVQLREREGGQMLAAGGLAMLEELKLRASQIRCLLITSYDTPEYMEYFVKAVWLGAEGFALKNPPQWQWQGHGNRIANLIKAMAWGNGYYEPKFVRELASVADESLLPVIPYMGTLSSEMTPREKEVAELLKRGMTNREIAGQLQTTENTIKTHVHNIIAKMSKFGVNKRGKLVSFLSSPSNQAKNT